MGPASRRQCRIGRGAGEPLGEARGLFGWARRLGLRPFGSSKPDPLRWCALVLLWYSWASRICTLPFAAEAQPGQPLARRDRDPVRQVPPSRDAAFLYMREAKCP